MPPLPGQEEPLKRMMKIVNSLLARNDCAPFREPVDWRGLELYDYPEIITKMMDLGTIKRKLERNQYLTAHLCALDIKLVWSNCMKYNADGSDFWLLAKSYARRFEDRYRKLRQELDVGENLGEDGKQKSGGTSGGGGSSSKSSKKSRDSTSSTSDKGGDSNNNSKSKSSSTGGGGDSTNTRSISPTPSSSGGINNNNPSLDVRAKLGANLFQLNGMQLGYVMTILEVECPHVLESWNVGSPDGMFNTAPTNGGGGVGIEDDDDSNNGNSSNNNNNGELHPEYPDKIEINIDEIPLKIFNKINAYVNDQINGGSTTFGSTTDKTDGSKSLYPDLDIYNVDDSINGGTATTAGAGAPRTSTGSTNSNSGSKRKKARKS